MRLGRWFTLAIIAALLPLPGQVGASQCGRCGCANWRRWRECGRIPLIGYGLVVGLRGTGDSQQTIFTTQMLANALQKMGMQILATQVKVKNAASVFVTANLPAFARPGMQLDVTVSSMGDASSLSGGTLLMTPLRAADGQIYAAAQGTLTVGGYSASGRWRLEAGEPSDCGKNSGWRIGGAGGHSGFERSAQTWRCCCASPTSRPRSGSPKASTASSAKWWWRGRLTAVPWS